MATIRQVNNDLSSLNVGYSGSFPIPVSIRGKANKKTVAAAGFLMLMECVKSAEITPKNHPGKEQKGHPEQKQNKRDTHFPID